MAAPCLLALVLLAADPGPAPAAPPAAVPPPPPAAAPAAEAPLGDDISLEEWKRDDWTLVRPKAALFSLDGYLRVRGDLLQRLSFDNGALTERDGDGTPVGRNAEASDGHANVGQASMRLRLEPRIRVNEQAEVLATVDLLDNLVLGSTPDSLVGGSAVPPLNLLAGRQVPPRRLDNALMDSVAVKRAWARVTALNEQLELRVGRMPDHWGLGLATNSGDCLDCNWGQVVDRISVGFKLFDHVLVPMVDWVSKGPSVRPFGAYDPEPLDAVAFDDVIQYGLRILREDHADDVHDATLHGHAVVNYGLSNLVRLQARDLAPPSPPQPFDPTRPPPATQNSERRDALLYMGDAYGKLYVGRLTLGAEVAVNAGSLRDTQLSSSGALETTTLMTLGGALEADYRLRPDGHGFAFGARAGAASGDRRPGFGALDRARTQRLGDHDLRNFQFSPDYHVDLLLFRRVIGTVTDAFYLRPEVAYRFDERVIARLAGVYSQAMYPLSTPSALGQSRAAPLGLEIDGEVFYGAEAAPARGQLMGSVAGGLLFPLAGMRNPTLAPAAQAGSFAWTAQARMYLTF